LLHFGDFLRSSLVDDLLDGRARLGVEVGALPERVGNDLWVLVSHAARYVSCCGNRLLVQVTTLFIHFVTRSFGGLVDA